MKNHLVYILLISVSLLTAQESINQIDATGDKQGVWQKTYPDSQQIRYQGTFKDNVEVGTFKFYCEECGKQPSVIKQFDGKGNAEVTFYTIRGEKVSEGLMTGKNKINTWTYFHKGGSAIMTKEPYKNGLVEGMKITFYPDGTLAEEALYKSGEQHGLTKFYSPQGVLLKTFTYTNGVLDGPATYYNAKGELMFKGNYVNDRKKGIWKTYENGTVVKEEKFPKPYKRVE